MASAFTANNQMHRPPSHSESAERSSHETDEAPLTRSKRLISHLLAPIRNDQLVEIELLLLTICTGIQDATSFPDYHGFASNQTGNTVLLALAFTVPSLTRELIVTANVGVSLCLFLAGGFVTGQIGHHFVNSRNRLWLLVCNAVQTALVFGAAAIQFSHPVEKDDSWALAALACLAFASGSQVVLSRTFQMPEISTAMATAAWTDLMVDANIFSLRNKARDRRLFFLAALVVGTFIGAGIYRTAGSAWAIFVSGMGKLLGLVLFLSNKSEEEECGDEEKPLVSK